MKISVIGTTNPNFTSTKSDIENFSGQIAGVCYMPGSFKELQNEPIEKTQKRIIQTKTSGHHSVYDHANINLYLENIPKMMAMILNNEQQYTTSEKSARYTKMVLSENEQKLYDKWLDVFKNIIKDVYQKPENASFFTDGKIEKLAQENARYLISVFTPTSMIYSTTYRQLNYIYGFMQKEINKEQKDSFSELLIPSMKEFCKIIENTEYFDEILSNDGKNRNLSFFNRNPNGVIKYFGDVYATNYHGSFAQLAQAHRHRTLTYSMNLLNKNEFYIPPIIISDSTLTKEWSTACEKQAGVFPQGMLVNINEFGTLDKFILKMKERRCTFAQLEIDKQTGSTLMEYVGGLKEINHPRAEELELYTKGSRCTFPNYKCTSPCNFKEGITGERLI